MEGPNIQEEAVQSNSKMSIKWLVVVGMLMVLVFILGYWLGSAKKNPIGQNSIRVTAAPVQDMSEATQAVPSETALTLKGISFSRDPSLIYVTDDLGFDLIIFASEEKKNMFEACISRATYKGVSYRNFGECNLYDVGVNITVDQITKGETLDDYLAKTKNEAIVIEKPTKMQIGELPAYKYIEEGMGKVQFYLIQNGQTIYKISGNYFDDSTLVLFDGFIQTIQIN